MESPREQCAKEGCSGCSCCQGRYSNKTWEPNYDWNKHEKKKRKAQIMKQIDKLQAELKRL